MNRFKVAREKAHLSQKSAAISIGVKAPSMSAWENGTARPTIENLVAMAELYGVTVDYLLGVDTADETIKKEPAAISDDELRSGIVSRIRSLSDPALVRVGDFLDGLEAGQAIGSAPAAAPGSDAAPAPGSRQA